MTYTRILLTGLPRAESNTQHFPVTCFALGPMVELCSGGHRRSSPRLVHGAGVPRTFGVSPNSLPSSDLDGGRTALT